MCVVMVGCGGCGLNVCEGICVMCVLSDGV